MTNPGGAAGGERERREFSGDERAGSHTLFLDRLRYRSARPARGCNLGARAAQAESRAALRRAERAPSREVFLIVRDADTGLPIENVVFAKWEMTGADGSLLLKITPADPFIHLDKRVEIVRTGKGRFANDPGKAGSILLGSDEKAEIGDPLEIRVRRRQESPAP